MFIWSFTINWVFDKMSVFTIWVISQLCLINEFKFKAQYWLCFVTYCIELEYTKYALACPARNQTTKTTAETFFIEFVTKCGVLTRIHSIQTSRVRLSVRCANWWVWRSHAQPHTTHRVMRDQKGSTGHSSRCLGPLIQTRRKTGETTLTHWCMHTIAHHMRLQELRNMS